ncbi:MAG: acyltransferase [Verrucomicrobiota bacterium]|jgi:galactoside O-acetyltransferase
MSFLTHKQLVEIGFLSLGQNVLVSEKASIYGASRIRIGCNVRIDDFCVLSAGTQGIRLGNNIHIGCYTSLIGKAAISLDDYSNLSSRVSIYSSNDDYSGNHMTNPMVPAEFTNVDHRPVRIGRHCIVGSGTVILPGVIMEEGSAAGALSLIIKDCASFGIYVGVPARFIKKRKRGLLEREKNLLLRNQCKTTQ